jgi:hypothetical protein
MWDVSRLVFAFAAFSGSWSAGLSIEHTLLVYAMAQAISYVALVALVRHVLMRKRSSHAITSPSLTGATSEETGPG